jgi:hypothetical protein
MSRGVDLLKLLEPAVRPVLPAAGTTRSQGRAPFEQQDFAELMNFMNETPPEEAAAAAPPPKSADPLAELADLGRIENAGLRQMLADAQT